MDGIELEISNLVQAFGKGTLPELIIKRRYKDLEEKKNSIKNKLQQIEFELNNNYEHSYDFDKIMEYLKTFKDTYEYLSFEEKKKFLKSIIEDIRVDKNNITLKLKFLPTQAYDLHAFCFHKDKGSYYQLA